MTELLLLLGLFAIPIGFFVCYPTILRYEKGRQDKWLKERTSNNTTNYRKPTMNTPRSSTETLIKALRILSTQIDSEDGVANTAISEAADGLEERHKSSLAAVKDIEAEDDELNYTHRWDPIVFDRREFDDNAEPGPEAYMVNESYGKWVEYDVASAIVGGLKIRNQILNDRLNETLDLLERVFQCFEPQCHDDDVLYEEAKNFITKTKEEQQ